MTEEEKEAIKMLKEDNRIFNLDEYELVEYTDIALNLIEKQQREIERNRKMGKIYNASLKDIKKKI